MNDYILIPFSGGFIKRKRQSNQTIQPADHTQNGIRRVYTPSAGHRQDSQNSNEPQFEDLEIWKEPKIITTYDSEYTKIHLIHWYFKSRDNLKLSNIEKFHFSMLYMSDFDCKFDEIYFSVALDDINNETEKQFVRSQIEELTKSGTAAVDINFIQNDATKGELDTWLRIFDFTYDREDKCLLFYSHFKGVRHETNVGKMRNIKYWNYLMYQGCLIDGWGEGMIKLPTNAMYGSYLRNNESDTSYFKLYDEYKKTKIFSNYLANNPQHYSGAFYWMNLDFLRKNFFENKDEIKNTCLGMKSNLWFIKSHVCEYLPCSFSFMNGKLSSYSKYKNTELSNVSGYILYKSNIIPKEIENLKNIYVIFLIKNRKEKIVISMTSWVKRINNVSKMIDKIKNQTLQPDHVYLTLSTDEFPNKENDLPKELVEIVDDWFTINWVKENTKTIKKIFPILHFLNDDDIIMNLDDDMLNIPDDLIQCRCYDYFKLNKKFGITANGDGKLNIDGEHVYVGSGCCGLYSKKMLRGYDIFVDTDVTLTYEDDFIYPYIMFLNNYKLAKSSKYNYTEFVNKFCVHDEFGNDIIKIRETSNTLKIVKERYYYLKKKWANEVLKNKKILVYSYAENIKSNALTFYKEDGIDYILYTNNSKSTYNIKNINEAKFTSVFDRNRFFKFNSDLFKGYDYVIYHDASVDIKNPFELILSTNLSKYGMSMCKHPSSKSIGDELDLCLKKNKISKDYYDKAKLYLENNFAITTTMPEATVIIYDVEKINTKLVNDIFKEYIDLGIHRDQIVITDICLKNKISMDDICCINDTIPWRKPDSRFFTRTKFY